MLTLYKNIMHDCMLMERGFERLISILVAFQMRSMHLWKSRHLTANPIPSNRTSSKKGKWVIWWFLENPNKNRTQRELTRKKWKNMTMMGGSKLDQNYRSKVIFRQQKVVNEWKKPFYLYQNIELVYIFVHS